jgi:hypothetical protein
VKFRVERESLGEAVAWVARALPSRPVVPVLSGLRLEAGEDGLTLSCFDYEVSARVLVDAEVQEPGTALVPGRLLAEITRSLPPMPAEFCSAGDMVSLTCGSAEFTLVSLSVEDYPALPEPPEPAGSVDGGVLAAAAAEGVAEGHSAGSARNRLGQQLVAQARHALDQRVVDAVKLGQELVATLVDPLVHALLVPLIDVEAGRQLAGFRQLDRPIVSHTASGQVGQYLLRGPAVLAFVDPGLELLFRERAERFLDLCLAAANGIDDLLSGCHCQFLSPAKMEKGNCGGHPQTPGLTRV